jgi:hypothetical protein
MPSNSAAQRKSQSVTLPTRSAISPRGSKSSPEAMMYLSPLLPTGWERSFVIRRAGRAWGLLVQCPVCGLHPPVEIAYGLRRWRWLSVHITTHRPVVLASSRREP